MSDESSDSPIQQALRTELSWTHYRLLIKVDGKEARNYYMKEAAEQNWNTRNLERQINSLNEAAKKQKINRKDLREEKMLPTES